jgi:alcohol dehydrogenase
MVPFEFRPLTRVFFGTGVIDRLGTLAREAGARRVLLVSDSGVVRAGHAAAAQRLLEAAGIDVHLFQDFGPNPDGGAVEAGRAFAAPLGIGAIVAVGGGSSMDCAKGINFVLTNGGAIADYRGYGKAQTPLLPMLGVPTTAGTGSEAQSYAVIGDAYTHVKMACGDPTAAFRVALLDPSLTLSAPFNVTAIAGYDALAHAVETAATTRCTPLSEGFSHQAWRLLTGSYERALTEPEDFEARSAMQVGAFLAGMAIEQSMLGAAHACANPLTARYDIAHGAALAILLPHVVRWNADFASDRYTRLLEGAKGGQKARPADRLAGLLESLAAAGGLAARLSDAGVEETALPALASLAGQQWTGSFNPRPFDEKGALEIYRLAF